MPARATYITVTPLRRRPSHRRWDISLAILHLLKSGPKTASRLYRILNPGMRRAWALTPAGWKRRPFNVRVDKRVLMRHLRYLLRDGLIGVRPELKILERDHSQTAWLAKYYRLQALQPSPTPPRSPSNPLNHVSKIHNPLPSEEGMRRFIRWLRDPQPG